MATSTDKRRELAHRFDHGIHVSLFWDAVGDTLSLEVYDAKAEEYFEIDVPRDRALDAFRHPFAYLAATEAVQLDAILAA